jgi:HPt (histidine-containing phosphotransfer) domain-containing protein
VSAEAIARLQRIGGAALLKEMIALFSKHTPERLALVREGLTGGDLSLSRRGAHSMKSTAANFGADRLSTLAARVEAAAEAGSAAQVEDLLPELEREAQNVLSTLANLSP